MIISKKRKEQLKCYFLGKHTWVTNKTTKCKYCKLKKESSTRMWLTIIGRGLVGSLKIVGAVAMIYIIANLCGYSASYVSCSSQSMYPTLKCNSVFVYKILGKSYTVSGVKACYKNGDRTTQIFNFNGTKNNIKIGDIILFNDEGFNIVHRVTGLFDDCVVTMGDNNLKDDGCMPYSAIEGKVIWYFNWW